MSTLRVSNVHFDSTSTNFIDNRTTNTIRVQTTNLELNASSITVTGAPLGIINVQTFDASGTWTKPSGYSANSRVHVQVWSAGGSGARVSPSANGRVGGCGGGYAEFWYNLSTLGSTETITVGAGGSSITTGNASGANGGTSSFGSYLNVIGGEGGRNQPNYTTFGLSGGLFIGDIYFDFFVQSNVDFTGNTVVRPTEGRSGGIDEGGCDPEYIIGPIRGIYRGGGGGATRPNTDRSTRSRANGAISFYGGGGGGAFANLQTTGVGGDSVYGGRGGNAATNFITAGEAGQTPGGGGGTSSANNAAAVSGAGGNGRIIVTVFPA